MFPNVWSILYTVKDLVAQLEHAALHVYYAMEI